MKFLFVVVAFLVGCSDAKRSEQSSAPALQSDSEDSGEFVLTCNSDGGQLWVCSGNGQTFTLKGDTGDQGLPGTDGAAGATGPQGPQGLPGDDGLDGLNGASGTSCTVTQVAEGAFVECSDGTQALVEHGEPATTQTELNIVSLPKFSCVQVSESLWAVNKGSYVKLYSGAGCSSSSLLLCDGLYSGHVFWHGNSQFSPKGKDDSMKLYELKVSE